MDLQKYIESKSAEIENIKSMFHENEQAFILYFTDLFNNQDELVNKYFLPLRYLPLSANDLTVERALHISAVVNAMNCNSDIAKDLRDGLIPSLFPNAKETYNQRIEFIIDKAKKVSEWFKTSLYYSILVVHSESKGDDLMFGNKTAKVKLAQVEDLCNLCGASGGLIKRIDENRELIELIKKESPDFLKKNPWVVRWIQANDDFFTGLDEIMKAKRPNIKNFPREWPDNIKSK